MLASAIIGHLVGDYIIQNDWMAKGKKVNSFICTVHCFLWAFAVCLFAGWYNHPVVWVTLFVSHFVQDRTNIIPIWMGFVGQKSFRDDILSPWSIIVVDNVWHLVTVWLVWKLLI